MTNQPDPRPGLLDIMAYRGGVADAPGFAAPVKLSSNENCFGASEAAKQAIANESSRLERYPDGGAIYYAKLWPRNTLYRWRKLFVAVVQMNYCSYLVVVICDPVTKFCSRRTGF